MSELPSLEKVPSRAIAVDWSGALSGFRRKIWLAEVGDDGVRELRGGWSREEVAKTLVERAEADPKLIVGLDFSFSFPAWFVREAGCETAPDFWRHTAEHGEAWLDRSNPTSPYFFSRGSWPHADKLPFRQTELELRERGHRPRSPHLPR